MSKLDLFIEEILTWVGTPYSSEGCKKGGGTTCLHYVATSVSRVYGMQFEALKTYSHKQVVVKQIADVVTSVLDGIADEVQLDEIQAGDIAVLFSYNIPIQPVVFLGQNEWVYCSRSEGVLQGMLPGNLQSQIYKIYRLREET
jgi:hypothetical protein